MWFNGTSCATPYAAGVGALIQSKYPSWTPAQIRQRIVETATDIVNVESGTGWDRYSGYGMVNAGLAVEGIPEVIVLQNETINTTEIYEAKQEITAGPSVLIEPPGDVTFRAGNIIRLLPGFKAQSGSKFHALIDPSLR
jgi:subtilisin family serine protease